MSERPKAEADQIDDEQEARRRGRSHRPRHEALDGADHRPEPQRCSAHWQSAADGHASDRLGREEAGDEQRRGDQPGDRGKLGVPAAIAVPRRSASQPPAKMPAPPPMRKIDPKKLPRSTRSRPKLRIRTDGIQKRGRSRTASSTPRRATAARTRACAQGSGRRAREARAPASMARGCRGRAAGGTARAEARQGP